MARIPNVNTLADLIDRLIVEIHKLAFFENKKREEHAKESPDESLIVKFDNLSRECCELRSLLKNEINSCLQEIVETGIYAPAREPRTFRPAAIKVEDILSEMCMNSAERSLKGELVKALEETLKSE